MKFGYLTRQEVEECGFASVGEDVMIHSQANIVGAPNIHLGSHIRIDGFLNLVAQAQVKIGNHVHIGSFCHISASEEIRLGDFSGLSQGVCLYTASDDYTGDVFTHTTIKSTFSERIRGKVILKDHVILGPNTVVMPGVTIGEGAAVGALSLVKRDLDEWGIYGGVPAQRIRPRSRALLAGAVQHRKPK